MKKTFAYFNFIIFVTIYGIKYLNSLQDPGRNNPNYPISDYFGSRVLGIKNIFIYRYK